MESIAVQSRLMARIEGIFFITLLALNVGFIFTLCMMNVYFTETGVLMKIQSINPKVKAIVFSERNIFSSSRVLVEEWGKVRTMYELDSNILFNYRIAKQ